MRVEFPKCKWKKHITGLRQGTTSGWDWYGPQGPERGSWVNEQNDLQAGDLVIGYETAGKHGNLCVLWVVIDGPRLYTAAETGADQYWSNRLVPDAMALLQLSYPARALFAVTQLLAPIRQPRNRPRSGASANEFNALTQLQSRYARLVAADNITDVNSVFVTAAFDDFVSRQAETCQITPAEVLQIIGRTVPGLRSTTAPTPKPTVEPGGTSRRLTFRQGNQSVE